MGGGTTLRRATLLLLWAAVALASVSQLDEDLTFDEDSLALRQRREAPADVAPVEPPSSDDERPSSRILKKRQAGSGSGYGWNFWGSTDDEDADLGSAVEGSGLQPEKTADENGCRGDDQISCANSDKTICDVQRCDGVRDCPEGDDEEGCSCPPGSFVCDQVRCLPEEKKCDEQVDCMDQTDEIGCQSKPTCRSDDQGPRQCNDGTTYACFCDGITECPTAEDEASCGSGCSADQFSCDGGTICLDTSKVCDTKYDCYDQSDEENCGVVVPCRNDEYTCKDGTCVESFRQCDGIVDCNDGDDEESCPCEPPNFECISGMCIRPEQRCDGKRDCDDGSDEEVNCPCQKDEFTCRDGQCISDFLRCDGEPDCSDNTDEVDCPECGPKAFHCNDKRCIPEDNVCDGVADCDSDELDCCEGSGMFLCESDGTCLTDDKVCNDVQDCPGGEDESKDKCPGETCQNDEYKCNDGNCISITQRCDGIPQCSDRSDEDGCPCGDNQWSCADGMCIPLPYVCDGRVDCSDYSDEDNCENQDCEVGKWQCRNGQCIPEEQHCDKVPQCTDRSDEENCEYCGPDEWRCNSGSCIPLAYKCDGRYDCPDSSDEENCIKDCGPDEWRCNSGSCIPLAYKCDGRNDCPDSSDEQDCIAECSSGEWTCRDGSCIPQEGRCDGIPQCYDRSDEENCRPGCTSLEWQCEDGTCIAEEARCDNQYDCPDYTDEYGCPACGSSEWTCGNGACISNQARCDGIYDCPDYTDEMGCEACDATQWTCRDGSCIPQEARCNRLYDCPDYSDEENCQQECGIGEWTCRNGDCIPDYQRCDNTPQCIDRSDEENCVPVACSSSEWTCSDGTCIPQEARCNRQYDCPDYSDEEQCEGCRADEWTCRNGDCIPGYQHCDGTPHCLDRSDEENCNYECQAWEWTCRDRTCILQDLRCDGLYDCPDYSDEEGCTVACQSGEWTCRDGTCIPEQALCDGHYDCQDYSDESYCGCGRDQWTCRDGSCIPATGRCNRIPECIDRSDEENCPGCSAGEWTCGDLTCIPETSRCNGQYDCRDYSDEQGCQVECGRDQWTCRDGSCIPASGRCDRIPQCLDRSDEENCPGCSSGQWTCGDLTCIPEGARCNGQYDCPDYSDEQNCPACMSDEFACIHDGVCIPKSLVCDGRPYCRDGSDEQNCTPDSCTEDEFQCADGTCIPRYLVCDGQSYCRDGSDEWGCSSCDPILEWQCDYAQCIDRRLRCDGKQDCPTDASDERDCLYTCRPDQFRCEDGRCLEITQRCNGREECSRGEDERECGCRYDEFTCVSDRFCISNARRCDGYVDCRDGSDEQECNCHPYDEWQCNNRQCIPINYLCDGRQDCSDNSDELDPACHQCREDEFRCGNGACIPGYQQCNGFPECLDGLDEQNCHLFRCFDGSYIKDYLRCDGRRDCQDGSDEEQCSGTDSLNLRTYPDQQTIQQSREVVFQCRDEGSIRASVKWVREGNRAMPIGTTDVRGRLTMPNIQIEHQGTYYCEAQGVNPSMAGRRKPVYLQVIPYTPPTQPPVIVCSVNEATCMNGQCIDKSKVCNGVYDCDDASDEMRCNPLGCEPNEFQCDNKRCVLKTWLCDSDDDCGDGSDERECVTNPPGSACRYNEFTCLNGSQCIPKSFHCDGEVDCLDSSDEQRCTKPIIVDPPPRNIVVAVSESFTITCRAVGVPTPTVIWRLNWGHVPDKCKMSSEDGRGTLTCPGAQPTDQGAYSCEAINSLGSVFAQPDCIVQVQGGSPICQPPQFNAGAVSPEDCLSCFCFGATDQCYSTDRYITQLPPPLNDSYQLVGANLDQFRGNYVVREKEYPLSPRYLRPQSYTAVRLYVDRTKLGGPSDLIVYFSLPDSHKGQQLTSYGGYLRYSIQFASSTSGTVVNGPDVVMVGNGLTLMHVHDGSFRPNEKNQIDVKLQTGQWFKRVTGQGYLVQTQEPASREEIMMVLENVQLLLIRAQYTDALYIETTLSEVQMDTAVIHSNTQGRAMLVEECRCPTGYVGLSCQDCAPNYKRVQDGPWLGRCVPDDECRPGEYGDPANGIPCLPCPCPLTTPTNQFSSSCYLASDGQVTCNCQQGYQGRRCEVCASGYEGNPSIPGDSCRPVAPTCEWYEFICGDMSRCVHKDKRCDFIMDCPDGSDEDFCETVCMTTFTCPDGTVHPWSRRCDGIKDCPNFEDEKECDVCFNSGHRCSNGYCIHFERICDGHEDCYDGSDEFRENCLDGLPCDHIHEWTCDDRTCIDRSVHCNGIYDCPDGSDERYCNCSCNAPTQFKCQDGACLSARVRCNGIQDCMDGSDEYLCCDPVNEHSCGDGTCIDMRLVCNGQVECSDYSDEPDYCQYTCDPSTMHQCGDGTCIDLRQVCDGQFDCLDYSDESPDCRVNCDPNSMHQCGDGTCIDLRRVCDGLYDCRDYSDEPSSCQRCDDQNEFTCTNGECISRFLYCNGFADCRDGSDEFNCPVCNEYQFQCGDGSCIDRRQLCDSREDCRDGSDESEQAGCCVAPYFFQCNNGDCIDSNLVCNYYNDCYDGSDEYGCTVDCDPAGSYSVQADPVTGLCQCKDFVTGPKCDRCKEGTFFLNERNRFGCIDCFCMGFTKSCTSSNWYRAQETASFTNDRHGFELVEKDQKTVVSNKIYVDAGQQEIVFREFSRSGQEVYYWNLPQRFLGDKVSSYGGNLTYTVRYVPAPGGQSSANSAADVEIYGNDITLRHFRRGQVSRSLQETLTVPFYEDEWERQSGQKANREHFLMVLADLEYIQIKATYTTNTQEVALKEVIMDYAEPRNTGQERAYAVEFCQCPPGYKGLSCEDCDVGYTRSESGIHLGECHPCDCNGHSEECNPDTGVCSNCRDNTAGNFCERCADGFFMDPTGRCTRIGPGADCNCDPRGSLSTTCRDGRCQCKANVRGDNCDACQGGFFHLSSGNPEGCLRCWCSGVTSQCFSSNYYQTQLPMQLLSNHGFAITNRLRTNIIRDRFDLTLADNEISFSNFNELNNVETYYWSLPQMFTGNRLASYGGNLTISQRYLANPGGNTYADPDVIIRSTGGREFIWMNSQTLRQNTLHTYVVPLIESSFTMNQQPASRSGFLQALSSVEAIFIRATLNNRMRVTSLRDVIMDTAVPSETGQPRAVAVEQCQCPAEYGGLSCEQCKPGYYRELGTNMCLRCQCNGHEESCVQLPSGEVKCKCLPGYFGDHCEGSGLLLELRPMKVLFSREARDLYENFTCSYHASEPHRIMFAVEPTIINLDDTAAPLMDAKFPYATEEYTNGEKHFVTLHLFKGHRTVTCRVFDVTNKEVAQMVSQIIYVNRDRRARPPSPRPDDQSLQLTILTPTIQVVSSGSTVQMKCQARSRQGPQNRVSVTWNKADGELPYGRSVDDRQGLLVISQVQVSDSGTYICTASDGFHFISRNATLDVGGSNVGSPRVTIEERREILEVRRGQTLEIRCSAQGSPQPQVVWSRGPNRERLPYNVQQQNGILIFRDVETDNDGEYFCTATNSLGTDYARIIISVVESRPFVTPAPQPLIIVQVSEQEVEVKAGETVRVSCSSPNPGTLRIEWNRVGGNLPTQSSVSSGLLLIPNARAVDSGIYVCRITDERSSFYEESSTRITINEPWIMPTVQIQPDRQTINQGSNAELTCIVTGTPSPQIKWSKVNEEFGVGVQVEGNVLRIFDAVVSDRGMYVCTAENPGGMAQGAAIVEVERREPPSVQIYPQVKQTIVVGASALFQCHLTGGIPSPVVRWGRTDGRPLSINTETLNGGVLRFNQVQGDEEGSYTCTAENDAGSVTASAVLEIQSLPLITIRQGPSPYAVRVGERLVLDCSASGDPSPSVTWQKLEINLPTNVPSQSTAPNIAVYEVQRATKNDAGTYQCSARNAAGVSEERIQVIVEDALPGYIPEIVGPIQPETPTIYVPIGGNYEFTCRDQGPDAATTTYEFKRSDNRPLPRGNRIEDGVLYLTNVDQSASGEYACIGKDRISGIILFTIYATFEVIAPPRITLDPARQIVRPGDLVHIRCIATGPQPITINWSKDGGYMPPSVIINGGEMMFRGIETSDAGRYICQAVNNAGTARAVAEVIVNEPEDSGLVLPPNPGTERRPGIGIGVTEDLFFDQFDDEDDDYYYDQSSTPDEGYYLSLSDEEFCQFLCRDKTICLPSRLLCDGNEDCPDGSDEEECLQDFPNQNMCPYLCRDKTTCLQSDQVCDGKEDCGDGSDEEECLNDILSNRIIFDKTKCSDFFKCGNGTCYPFYLNCDDHCDCNDCKDEKICLRTRRHISTRHEEPLLTAIQRDIVRFVGQTAELRCEASGIDPNAVRWTRLGGSLPPSALTRGNLLRLSALRPEDSGQYQCEASSPAGYLSSVINLTVQSE